MNSTIREVTVAVASREADVSNNHSSSSLSSALKTNHVEHYEENANEVVDLTASEDQEAHFAKAGTETEKETKADSENNDIGKDTSECETDVKWQAKGPDDRPNKKAKVELGIDRSKETSPTDDRPLVDCTAAEGIEHDCDPEFASLVDLSPVPDSDPLPPISDEDREKLENLLQFGDKSHPVDGWREDWSGNLQLLDKEIVVYREEQPNAKPVLMSFHEWVSDNIKSSHALESVRLLFSHVYNLKVGQIFTLFIDIFSQFLGFFISRHRAED